MSEISLDLLAEDPHPALASLRRSSPVAWLDDLGGWMVTSHALCVEVLTDSANFTVDDERFSTRRVVGPSMLSLDGLEHKRHRSAFAPAFRSKPVRGRLENFISESAASLVEGIAAKGSADLRASVTGPLATLVMRSLLGLDAIDLDQLSGWNRSITAAIDEVTADKPVPDRGQAAFDRLRRAVAARLGSEGLMNEAAHRGGLTLDEIAANAAVLLIGGVVTSDGTMSIALRHLLDRQDIMQALITDPSLIPRAVDESMRLEPAAAFVDRYATGERRLGTVRVAAGDLVRVSISAANRDPEVFGDPDRFDLARHDAADHLSFARGPHACLGFAVARLETRICLEAILTRLPRLRAAGAPPPPPSGLIFRAPGSVPARWG